MPCISSDGKPTPTGMALLRSLKKMGPLLPQELVNWLDRPLPMVRSGLRELANAGFVEPDGEKYKISKSGETLVEEV